MNLGAGRGNSGIDKQLAVGSGQHRDVAARALQGADIAAQLVNLDPRGAGTASSVRPDLICDRHSECRRSVSFKKIISASLERGKRRGR
jgi:hypothetical protein